MYRLYYSLMTTRRNCFITIIIIKRSHRCAFNQSYHDLGQRQLCCIAQRIHRRHLARQIGRISPHCIRFDESSPLKATTVVPLYFVYYYVLTTLRSQNHYYYYIGLFHYDRYSIIKQ